MSLLSDTNPTNAARESAEGATRDDASSLRVVNDFTTSSTRSDDAASGGVAPARGD